MTSPITPYSGTVPNPFTQSQPAFDANTQSFVDYITQLPGEINQFSADLGTVNTNSTSTTSNTIGTGSKAFTVQPGKSYFPGQSVTIARTSAPSNRMFAVVDSYNSGSGALVVTSQAFEGSGTFTGWTITLGFNGVISAGQIPDSVVTTSKINNGAVTTGKIAQGAASGLALGDKIQPITASVDSNALTITLNPTTLDFRDATLGSGTVNTRIVSAPISVVVSSGSTLGTVNGVQSRLAVLAISAFANVELAVVNMAGGINLDETGLIGVTAEGGAGGADSASVVYGTNNRVNRPYRVVGFIESTQATAGTWATAPSKIQGYGGQAFAAMSSLGYGQTWQDVSGSRVAGTTYYNTTGKPIVVNIQAAVDVAVAALKLTIGGVAVVGANNAGAGGVCAVTAIVPPNQSYVLGATLTGDVGTIGFWNELR